MNRLKFIYQLASPRYFYEIAGKCIFWFALVSSICLLYGFIGGLLFAPPDYQQGDGFRIIYVHVPSAVLSLTVYMIMAMSACIYFIWRIKLADIVAQESAPIGAMFAFLALITGSFWGKPMWGTWWVWDARLTSELILLFLYFGYMALRASISELQAAAKASGILLFVGVIDIPIIHYSVDWWNTLHQGATVLKFSKPSIVPSMLYPLLAMLIGFFCYFIVVLLMRARVEVLSRENESTWVRTL